MSVPAKILIGAWMLSALVGAVFVLSVIVTLVALAFGEPPAAALAINAVLMPWGGLAIFLMIALRRIAGWAIRKERAFHGR